MMMPLPEACHVALDVRNVSKCFSFQGIFLILERAKNHGLNQINKVDGPFLEWILWPGTRVLLTHHAQGHCYGRESTFQAEYGSFPPKRFL
jgi:hypothetical protein